MVAEQGSDPHQPNLVTADVGDDSRAGQELTTTTPGVHDNSRLPRSTLLAAALPNPEYTNNNRPWRRTILRQVPRPESGVPPPPALAPTNQTAGGSLPSTPQPLTEAISDSFVDQAVNNTTLSEPVARVASTAMKSVLHSCARRLNAPSPAAVDPMAAHDLLASEDKDDEARVEEPQRQCPDTSDPSWRQHVHIR